MKMAIEETAKKKGEKRNQYEITKGLLECWKSPSLVVCHLALTAPCVGPPTPGILKHGQCAR